MRPATLIISLLLALSTTAFADGEAGTIKISRGDAAIERNGSTLPASVGSAVLVSDQIVTGEDGAVGITLRDNTRLTAGPNTTLDLNTFSFDTTTHAGAVDASVTRGSLSVISGKIAKASPNAVRFNTPTVTLGVRGTEFIIEVDEQEGSE
ncbi:MAG: FecR domain-containing protein [Halieaceae bacterium]